MSASEPLPVQDPAQTRLRLRADLVCQPRRDGDRDYVLVEDPLRAKFFRLGRAEFTLAALLDGRRTLHQAVGEAAAVLAGDALATHDALTLADWLVRAGLAEPIDESGQPRVAPLAQRNAERRSKPFNPLAISIPLVNPDRWLDQTQRWANHLFSLPALICWLAVALAAVGNMAGSWSRLVDESRLIFDPTNGWHLAVAWMALKLWHEACHAFACKRFGGQVTRAGVVLMLGLPVAFVDTTSAWRFASRWRRIVVSAAGIYAELFVAGLALLTWLYTAEGELHRLARDVAVVASVHTLVFNANPLMRFDGYYVLADLLGLPNLAALAHQHLGRCGRTWLLGLSLPEPPLSQGTRWFLGAYGVAALVWKIVVFATLAAWAVATFAHLGAIAVLAWGAFYVVVPVAQAGRRAFTSATWRDISSVRLATVASAACLSLAVGAWCALAPATLSAPAVVDYAPAAVVRATSPGFAREVRVCGGQTVAAGQVIAVLENDELVAELAAARRAVEQAIVRGRMHHAAAEIAKEQAEADRRLTLETRHRELQARVDALVIRAPVAGQIVGRDFGGLLGKYLRVGDTIAVVGSEDAKELLVAVPHGDAAAFQHNVGHETRARLAGAAWTTFRARLDSVEPAAQTTSPHDALSARAGGPLAERMLENDDRRDEAPSYALLTPCYRAHVRLSPEQSRSVLAGQVATVRLVAPETCLASRLARQACDWFERQTRAAGSHRGGT